MVKRVIVVILCLLVVLSLFIYSSGIQMVFALTGSNVLSLPLKAKASSTTKASIEMSKESKGGVTTYSSIDKSIVIKMTEKKDGAVNMEARIETGKFKESSLKNISRFALVALDYMKMVLNEEQAQKACAVLIKDTLDQYKKGEKSIYSTFKDKEAVVSFSGSTKTGIINININNKKQGDELCQTNKSKPMGMKALPR